MKSRIAIIAAIVSVCAGITPAQAQQANSLVGRWSIEYEVGRRIENGDVEAIRGKGQFTIAQSGDSLLVTLQGPARPDGTTPPRATMGARATADATTFTQKQQLRINIDGAESVRDVILTWTLRANGDALTGTLARTMQDAPEMTQPSTVTGTRVK